jgi:hypothetical protein
VSNAAGSKGLAMGVDLGASTITAAQGVIMGSTTLTVSAATLVSVAVTPGSQSAALGLTAQFGATGTFSDGSTQTITDQVTWSSSNPSLATVSNAMGSKGLSTSAAVGVVSIIATLNGLSGSGTFTITGATLTSIVVTPASTSTTVSSTVQFTAVGHYSDGSMADLTNEVSWSSSLPATATISNAGGTCGLATAVAMGNTTISATLSGVTGSTTLTVN